MSIREGTRKLALLGASIVAFGSINAARSSEPEPCGANRGHFFLADRPEAPADTAGQLDRTLQEIAAKYHIAVVAEGEPQIGVAPESGRPELPPSPTFSLDALHPVWERFDYSGELVGNVLVLKKRYSRSGGVPPVTLAECAALFESVARCTNPYNPHFFDRVLSHRVVAGRDIVFGELIASFSAEQMRQMDAAPVLLSSLSEEQQTMVKDAIHHQWFEMLAWNAAGGSEWLAKATRGDISFCYGDSANAHHVFGIQVPLGANHTLRFVSLTDPSQMAMALGGVVVGKSLNLGGNTDVPAASSVTALPEPSLTDAGERLRRESGSPRIEIDKSIGGLPLVCAGVENAKPADVLSAAASIYGLKVESSPSPDGAGRLRLTSRDVPTAQPEEAAVVPAIVHTLPDNVARWLHVPQRSAAQAAAYHLTLAGAADSVAPLGDHSSEETTEELRQAREDRRDRNRSLHVFEETKVQFQYVQSAPDAFRAAVVERLRQKLQPLFARSANGQVPIAEVDDSMRDDFAGVVLATFLSSESQSLVDQPNTHLGHWDAV